ncbi:sushi, nidogen and EGF-like domain-containing protein 1 [Strongylocentrotus purpuratus]|uniref:Sushi domain-containing protein n=1 Tax=Strongylocentrotus purpuratus TaxID=7668 RepID=A0A7M7NBW2_STRPU|nr:sushi, nidogen and EGF-like domain-containing protein 1 [Strongylocentrotus purpuratus]
MNNGAWNHQRPSCEAVECEGSPPEVALASTTILGSAYQDIALYTCQDSYIPDNEPISFCQHTGNWSSSYFTCTTRSPCNSNPCVNGGTCTVNGSRSHVHVLQATLVQRVMKSSARVTATPV